MTAYVRSPSVSRFRHGEYSYLYHDLFGYILQMSDDVLAFLDFFREPQSESAAQDAFRGTYEAPDVRRFVSVFEQYGCLVQADADETERAWKMFPVRSKWGVWRRNAEGSIVVYWSDGEQAWSRTLNAWQTAFWDALDGDSQLSVIYGRVRPRDVSDEFFRAEVLELVRFLTHSDRQILKLSEFPMGFYRKDARSTPPYLLSFLPYRRDGGTTPPPDPHRERARRSMYALFQEPNVILGQRTYGEALVEALRRHRVVDGAPRRVLDLSMDFGAYLKDVAPTLEPDCELHVLARDETDRAAYRAALGPHAARLRFLEGAPDRLPALVGPYDLVLAVEVLGSLEHVLIEGGKPKGAAASFGSKYGLFQGEAGERFLFNLGAARLLETLAPALAPGGRAVLIDYGDEYQRPAISTTAEVPYYLVHFGELKTMARKLDLSVVFSFLIDFVEFARDRSCLSTNRHHFASLRRAFADEGVELSDVPYTAEQLAPHLAGRDLGNVFFEKVEDRCFGTVPHQLKVLVLGRPDRVEL